MDTTAVAGLAESGARGLGTIAGAMVTLVIAWQFFKVLWSGSERALYAAAKTLLVIGIAIAVLSRAGEVGQLAGVVGSALLGMVIQAIRSAFTGA